MAIDGKADRAGLALARTALAAALSLSLACSAPATALAEETAPATGSQPEDTSEAEPDSYQLQIERTAAVYDKAEADLDAVEASIADNEARIGQLEGHIADLEAELADQQPKSDRAVRNLYKLQNDSSALLGLVVDSSSFPEFLDALSYVTSITSYQMEQTRSLARTKSDLEESKAQLEQTRADLDAEHERALDAANEARSALEAAQDAREQAQERAAAAVEELSAAGATPDGADWGVEEGVFVSEWAPRIDAYLAGSPMEGTGEAFARAAWTYGVDPRWSPAISTIESSKGLYCIKPHNAWGWGAADSDPYGLASEWETWEEAIDAHVRGLARGYGYTVSVEAAQKYCPPNWERWYAVVSSEMQRI